ncbi:hypothetical protein CHELA1G11_11733 [Hyphomicrobiales bacterium]|nr:hypothetical protein CHELA1G11_11733 [Hyphomicrobiales bacterium]CAH1665733.1 hypothetical protein CHELA1G2_12574 [Hyphomicrobiales bacterium]
MHPRDACALHTHGRSRQAGRCPGGPQRQQGWLTDASSIVARAAEVPMESALSLYLFV